MRCRVVGGSTANLVVYGDSGNLANSDHAVNGYHAGVALVLPLSKPKTDSCDKPMNLHTATVSLEVAETLFTHGSLTQEEFNALATKIKAKLHKALE